MGTDVAQENPTDRGEALPVARPRTTAFFFGSAAQPLFGLYGPPQSEVDHDHGILLCAPAGHECMRAYWGLRLLGDQLIQCGFHVMRFDYSCLGDSAGDFEQASTLQWVDDIKTALAELQDTAGVRQISAIGVRLGAALAFTAAKDVPLHHLVMWDPVLDGQVYIDQFRSMQKQLLRTWPHAPVCAPGAAHEELLGFRYTARLIEQIRSHNLRQTDLPQAQRVSLVVSSDGPECRHMEQRLQAAGLMGAWRVVQDGGSWEEVGDDLYAEPLLQPNLRRAVVDLLRESA
jgi:pimeloyl-ACP methyl ester carboxylesterase